MTATAAIAEMTMGAATAMAMMPPLPPTATMLMRNTVIIRGRQMDDGDLRKVIGQ